MNKVKLSANFLIAACALIAVSALWGYVLLSPARTWDSAPDYIVGSLAHIAPIVRQMVISP